MSTTEQHNSIEEITLPHPSEARAGGEVADSRGGKGSRVEPQGMRDFAASPTDTPIVVEDGSYQSALEGSSRDNDGITVSCSASSLFIFSHENTVRLWCLKAIASAAFENTILLAIILNSMLLAADQPGVENPHALDLTLTIAEYFFTIFFTLEMLLKIFAFGLVLHKGAYLRSGWNIMDFIIVIASLISLGGSGQNYSALRVFRVLRPLRSVSRIKKLKHLIAGLFRAMPMVFDNFALLLFILAIFAIAAVQLWAGKYSQRCYVTSLPDNSPLALEASSMNLTVPFLVGNDTDLCGGSHKCESFSSINVTTQCAVHQGIFTSHNMNYDHLFTSVLLILKITVMDNWPDNVNEAMDFAGSPAAIFFFVLILCGNFFTVNLFLAILTSSYSDVGAASEEREGRRSAGNNNQGEEAQELLVTTPGSATSGSVVAALVITGREETKAGSNDVCLADKDIQCALHDTKDGEDGEQGGVWARFCLWLSDTMNEEVEAKREEEHGEEDEDDDFHESDDEDEDALADDSSGDRSACRMALGRLVLHKATEIFMIIVTIVNVVALSIDHWGIDADLANVLDIISIVCTAFFAIEISTKLIAFGFKKTLSKGFNLLDFFLVVLSIPDIVLSGGGASSFSALRVFRLLRVMRLLNRFESLQAIVSSFGHSVSSAAYLSLLILLMLYIFGILGMQLFGTAYGAGTNERARFGNLWESLLACFVTMTGENWTDKMIIGMNGETGARDLVPVIFFVALFVLGNYILLNLFVAIIVDKLQEKMEEIQLGKDLTAPSLVLPPMQLCMGQRQESLVHAKTWNLIGNMSPTSATAPTSSGNNIIEDNSGNFLPVSTSSASSPTQLLLAPEHQLSPQMMTTLEAAIEKGKRKTQFFDRLEKNETRCHRWAREFSEYITHVEEINVEGSSLFLFSPTNPVRRVILIVLGSTAFDLFITFVIIANCVFLLFESPLRTSSEQRVLDIADYVFTVIFLIEMFVKMIGIGVLFPKGVTKEEKNLAEARVKRYEHAMLDEGGQLTLEDEEGLFESETPPTQELVHPAYLRDPWNVVDGIVSVTALIGLFVPVFQVFRSLRTIRLMIRNKETKIVIVSMFQAMPHVINGFLLGILMFIAFGILGVQVFKGKFYQCNDPSVANQVNCTGTFFQPMEGVVAPYAYINRTRQWEQLPFHFDHFGAAVLSTFVFTAGDGWSTIMYNGMDTSEPGVGLQRDKEPWWALYFILVYISCNFFALNMVVSILINYFAKMRSLNDGSALMTESQRGYRRARETIDAIMFNDDLVPQNNAVAQALSKMMTYRVQGESQPEKTPVFEFFILTVVIINTAFIASYHYGIPTAWNSSIEYVNLTALIIFTLEFFIKILAYWPKRYFSLGWNRFDFIIVILGWVSLMFPAIDFISFLRVLRVTKLIRGTGAQKLIDTMILSINNFINVSLLLLMTIFVFAVAGVTLFGNIKLNGALTRNVNYQTVPNAVLLLSMIATTEGWYDVMHACSVQPPECSEAENNCGSYALSQSFHITYMVVASFVVLQLFVAIVVDSFSDSMDESDEQLRESFLSLRHVWTEKFGAAPSIHADQFVNALPYFPRPITGLPAHFKRTDVLKTIFSLELPIDSQMHLTYRNVVYSFVRKKYSVDCRGIAERLEDSVSKLVPGAFSLSQCVAARYLSQLWKEKARANQRTNVS